MGIKILKIMLSCFPTLLCIFVLFHGYEAKDANLRNLMANLRENGVVYIAANTSDPTPREPSVPVPGTYRTIAREVEDTEETEIIPSRRRLMYYNNCAEGWYYTLTTGCIPCPVGDYQNLRRQTYCRKCTPGYTTPEVGSISEGDCVPINCQPGSYYALGSKTCKVCPFGTFQSGINRTSCFPCPVSHSTRYEGAMNESSCEVPCSSGYQKVSDWNDNMCMACPKGTYKDNNIYDFINCTDCPVGFTTFASASTSESSCSVPICNPGNHLNETRNICQPCPVGTFQPNFGEDVCLACGEHQTTLDSGASSILECVLNCGPGQHKAFPNGTEECVPCLKGTFKTYWHPVDDCISCPENTTTIHNGSVSSDQCINDCRPGYYKSTQNDLDDCVPCDIGMYKSFWHPVSDCHPCPANFTTAFEASISVEQCSVPVCNQGHYLEQIQNYCEPCPIGTYQPNSGQTSCVLCEVDEVTLIVGSTSPLDCTRTCGPGYYKDNQEECSPCEIGTYKENWHTHDPCVSCPTNRTTADKASTNENACFDSRGLPDLNDEAYFNNTGSGDYDDRIEQEELFRVFTEISTTRAPQIDNEIQNEVNGDDQHDRDDEILDESSTSDPYPEVPGPVNCPLQHEAIPDPLTYVPVCVFYCESGFERIGNETLTCRACERGYYKDNRRNKHGSCLPCPIDQHITDHSAATSIRECKKKKEDEIFSGWAVSLVGTVAGILFFGGVCCVVYLLILRRMKLKLQQRKRVHPYPYRPLSNPVQFGSPLIGTRWMNRGIYLPVPFQSNGFVAHPDMLDMNAANWRAVTTDAVRAQNSGWAENQLPGRCSPHKHPKNLRTIDALWKSPAQSRAVYNAYH